MRSRLAEWNRMQCRFADYAAGCMYVHDRLRFRFINQCNRKMTNQEAYHASIDLF